MSTTTTTKIAARRTDRARAGDVVAKVASLLEAADTYGTGSIDVSISAQYRRYGGSAENKVDAVVRIVTD